ncbi:MAG: hypothetical protein JRH20_17765 [Deltaproteobacteria bacterium]|nr:hypothetical protein [Deltaproteobacteria bacterium]
MDVLIHRFIPRWLPVIVATLTLLSLTGQANAKPLWSFSPDKGFVDDPIAFSASGTHMAFILSDSATFMDVAVLELSSQKIIKRLPLGAISHVPQGLHFLDDNTLLWIWSDSQKGNQGAGLIWLDGKKRRKRQIKGATRLQLVAYEGAKVLAAATRQDKKGGGYKMRVQLHRLSDLRRIRAASVTVRADATLKRPALRVLYWGPGFTTLVGLKRGKFDKKRDLRLPDAAVWFDVLRRREITAYTPQKLVSWTQALEMREAHGQQRRFLHVDQNLKPLYLVSERNHPTPLATPVAWRLYEPKSLAQRESWDGKDLFFSMTIDPVNPDAVARKKADKERADIYRVDATGKPVILGKVLTGKRGFTWVVGKNHFAYMRKLKGFARGGKSIEVHALAQ